MSFKEHRTSLVITIIICLCAALFSLARYMGWLAQNNGLLGTMARNVYGPDVRLEMERLQHVKQISPEVPAVTVLCYHEVRPDHGDDCMNVKPDVFRRHIREFKEAGFTFIDVSALQKYSAGTSLPGKAVLITFDDGYADNYNYAYPILREEQVPATFFVVSSTVGHDNRMTCRSAAGDAGKRDANRIPYGQSRAFSNYEAGRN